MSEVRRPVSEIAAPAMTPEERAKVDAARDAVAAKIIKGGHWLSPYIAAAIRDHAASHARQAVEAEREACAKECESVGTYWLDSYAMVATECAQRILARD